MKRLAANVVWSVYLPLWLSGLISLTTIFVGYGDGLVSAFGDRASIAVTLMLTVVAWETPENLRTIKRVQNLKTWTFFLVTIVIIKDVVFTMYWWHTLYWKSEDIAGEEPVRPSRTLLLSLNTHLSYSLFFGTRSNPQHHARRTGLSSSPSWRAIRPCPSGGGSGGQTRS